MLRVTQILFVAALLAAAAVGCCGQRHSLDVNIHKDTRPSRHDIHIYREGRHRHRRRRRPHAVSTMTLIHKGASPCAIVQPPLS